METRVCPHCSHEQKWSLRYCTKCGKLLIKDDPAKKSSGNTERMKSILRKSGEPSSRESIQRKPIITKERLPLIGSIGVVGIAISLLMLLEVDDISIPPLVIYITGIIIFLLGVSGTYLLKRKNSIKDSSLILLLLTYEVIFLSTQFLYDMLSRSEYSRYSLLGSGLLILIVSASTRPYFEKSTFQSIHLIFGVYFGWVIIFIVSYSPYLSQVVFTVVTLLAIIITNYYSIRYPDVVISSAYNIIEALIIINAIFINFSYFFFVALLIFIGNPLLLYKFKNIEITKFLIYISLIPTVSVLYGISSSSLINPLPQILFVVFSLSWAWYLSKSDLPKKVIANLSVWLSAALMFGVFIYALSYSGFEVLLTYLGMTIVVSILVFNIDSSTRRKIQLANIILMFLVELILYPSYLSLGGLIIFFIVNIPIIFLQDIRLKEFSSNILLLGQIMVTTFFVIIYSIPLRTDDIVYYLLYFANIASIGLIYLVHMKWNYTWRYLSLVVNFVISTVVVMVMIDITGFLISGVILSILIISLVFLDKGLINSDMSVIGWLLILGLQTIIISLSKDLFVIDFAVFFTLVMGLLSYFVQSDKLTKYYLPMIISSVGIIARSLTEIEDLVVYKDTSAWALLLLIQFLIFTGIAIIYPMLTDLIEDNNIKIFSMVHFHHLVYLLVWMLLGKLIHGVSIEMEDEVLGQLIIITLQVGVMLLLGLLIFKKLGSYLSTEKFSIIPISLLLNLAIYLFDPSYFNEILSYIYILIISFYSIKLIIESEISQIWLIIWFVLLSINLVIIAGFGELSTFIAVFAGYAILQAINVIYSQKIDIPRYFVTFAFNVVFIAAGIISRVLPIDDAHSVLNSMIFWIVIIVSTHIVQLVRADAMKEELIFTSLLTIFSSILWMDVDIAWLSSLLIVIGMISIALSYKILFRAIEKDHLPKLNFETMSILLAFAGIVLSIVQLLLYNQVIELLLLNRIIFWSSLGIFLVLGLARKFVNRLTVILDVMIILSFLMVISTNLMAYFDSVLSNIVFLVLAMSFSIGGLFFKDYGTFYIGVGISILSALKALIDLVVIESSDKWFSVLIASVQLIWYTIVFSGPVDRIKQ